MEDWPDAAGSNRRDSGEDSDMLPLAGELFRSFLQNAPSSPVRPAVSIRDTVARHYSPFLRKEDMSAEEIAEDFRVFADGAVNVYSSGCVGHLHNTPSAVGIAADAFVGALNQSIDSWDQGPTGVLVEDLLIEHLAGRFFRGQGPFAGSVTSGATESNLMGLMCARERVGERIAGAGSVAENGVGMVKSPLVFASERAHHSIAQAASILGMGERAVVRVKTDESHTMRATQLRRTIDSFSGRGTVVAVVATAGTTDAGAIDELALIAEVASSIGAWLHIDGAYGGMLGFSGRHRHLVDGIELADSLALDFHKFGEVPVPAGVFLAKDCETARFQKKQPSYLGSSVDEAAGFSSRLPFSIKTTRRADAFKIACSLRSVGSDEWGNRIDRCIKISQWLANEIAGSAALELWAMPTVSTVLFRYARGITPEQCDQINERIRILLFERGRSVVGRCDALSSASGKGGVWLKITILKPSMNRDDLSCLLKEICDLGDSLQRRHMSASELREE